MRRTRFRTTPVYAASLLAGLFASAIAVAQPAGSGDAAAGQSAQSVALKLDPRLGEERAAIGEGRPVFGRGERLSGRTGRETTLEGDAEVRRAGTVIRADRLTYYEADDEVMAVGAVRVARQGNVFTGPQLLLKLDANEGWFETPTYYLGRYGGRGQAERMDFLGPDLTRLHRATYTTCEPDNPDWLLTSDTLTIDEASGDGTGRSASLYFKGLKILGAPVFAFPLSDERRSGFLVPSLSINSRSGGEVVVPYYWNIAPNRDFTFHPGVSARRGVRLGGEFRYLEPTYFGGIGFDVNPSDPKTGSTRFFYDVHNTFTNWSGWGGNWLVRGVSDDDYFVDYSRSILSSSERVLPRVFNASRSLGGDWSTLVSVQTWQAILDARPGPYERVPQVQLRNVQRDVRGFDVDTLLDATRFGAPRPGLVEGWRLVANPQFSYPIVRPGWSIVPKVSLHATSYQLTDPGAMSSSSSRVVPTWSIDAGMVFERPAHLLGRDVTQTLEPRLFYVRTPYRDQSRIPVFDTTVADFNFAQLFSENTFIGNDRIADVDQLTAAAISRVIDPSSGAERLRFAVGQRLYFSGQRVAIPGMPPRTDERSDVLLAAAGEFGGGMSFDTGLQYSVRDGGIPRFSALWRYLPPDGRILNLGLRYRRDELGQLDTSWRWPVAPRWVMLGRLNYSFLGNGVDPISQVPNERGVIEAVLGVEYSSCCWGTSFVLQRFRTAQGQSTTAFFLQLELKGLARIGSDPFGILRRNIPGYRLPHDRPELPSRYFGYE
jgi:LPS-assembly protein